MQMAGISLGGTCQKISAKSDRLWQELDRRYLAIDPSWSLGSLVHHIGPSSAHVVLVVQAVQSLLTGSAPITVLSPGVGTLLPSQQDDKVVTCHHAIQTT